MNDDLVIRSGGAIAVDTAALDAAAAELDAAASRLEAVVDDLRVCEGRVLALGIVAIPAQGYGGVVAGALADAVDEARELARCLRQAAATYEVVELRLAHRGAVAIGDVCGAAAAAARMRALEAEWPGATAAAAEALAAAGRDADPLTGQIVLGGIGSGLVAPAPALGLLGGLFAVRATGAGAVGRGRTPVPRGTAATLVPLPVTRTGGAPRGLADAASRIPSEGAGRVRVEQYADRGGGRAFAVYIAGTRSLRGADPWDMASNLQSYSGRRSDALATVEAALERAGAQPGDPLYAFGHSQGAMLAGQLEGTGRYDVRVLGAFGSPTAVDVGESTLSAQVRHGDDLVAALAAGGHEQRVGAEGSFIAERRLVDPRPGLHDATLPAHHLETYLETARSADASADPRVLALHDRLGALGEAELVEVLEFGAERAPTPPAP